MRAQVRADFCARLRGGPRAGQVLEVGCGPGTDAALLAASGLEVLATDLAPEFVEIVRERYPGLPARVMDMCAPDLPPASFMGIYGFACFVHLPRALAPTCLAALWGLLAPGGLLGLTWIGSRKGVRDYVIEGWAGDPECRMGFTCYAEEEARGLLEAAGYAEIEVLPLPPAPIYDELPRLVERGVYGFRVFGRRPG